VGAATYFVVVEEAPFSRLATHNQSLTVFFQQVSQNQPIIVQTLLTGLGPKARWLWTESHSAG
jgi:hypothetical protein